MIERLVGIVVQRLPHKLILDVVGVGYGIELPLSAEFPAFDVGKPATLWIYTRVREDELKLYGFWSLAARGVFELLLQVSGVGPKVALAIMSTLSLDMLRQAVEFKQPALFESVPGIGKRTAEKILLELQSKRDRLLLLVCEDDLPMAVQKRDIAEDRQAKATSSIFGDLKSALLNLGFAEKELNPVLSHVERNYGGEGLPELLKSALGQITQLRAKSNTRDQAQLNRLF